MNPLEPLFPSRHALLWIKAIYVIPLLGKMHGFSSRHSPNPTPRMREPLRLRQVTLASPQRLFHPLALGGVHHRSNKLKFSRFISFSMSHNMEMFDGGIRHQPSIFKIKILPLLRRALDYVLYLGSVFGMNALEHIFHRRCRVSVVPKNSIGFLGPDDLPGGNSPAKTSRVPAPWAFAGFGRVPRPRVVS